MNRSAKAVLLIVALGSALLAQAPKPQAGNAPAAPASPTDDKASAYYNFAMGRLYSEMAAAQSSRDYALKSAKYYQEALRLAPNVPLIADELTDVYLHLNRLQDAIAVAEDLLKKDPDNLNARRILGSVYMRMAQSGRDAEASLQKAIEQYQKITQKSPKDVDAWTTLGDLYSASSNSPEAEKAYKAALAADPASAEALKSLAKLYLANGDTKSAIEKLQAATEKDPSEETLAQLGAAYSDTGNHKEAVEAFQKAFEMAPDNDKIGRALAEEYLNLNPPKIDEAQKIFEQLAATNRREAYYPLRLSEIYRTKKDLAKAREYANRAKQLDPESIQIRLNDGILLEAENKIDEAVLAYKGILEDLGKGNGANAEEVRKGRLEILEQIANADEKAKRWADMAQTLDQAEKTASNNSEKAGVVFMRGAMLERQKQFEASEKEFRRVLDLDPKHAGAMNYLGYMLADRNVRLDEASQLVRKALDLEPENGAYLDSLGWVCFRQGKYSEAQGLLERALEHMADPTVHDHLGDVYAKQGKTKEAVAEWQASIKEAQKPGALDVDQDEMAKVNKKLDEAQAKLAKESHSK